MQNFAPGSSCEPQFEQNFSLALICPPHSEQNFESLGISLPHFAQILVLGPIFLPQTVQNFESFGIIDLQIGQGDLSATADMALAIAVASVCASPSLLTRSA